MAKKKTAGHAPAANAASDSPAAPAAPRRRRAATPAPEPPPVGTAAGTANDRAGAMPEPAGQRVTPADTSAADSVTFVTAPSENPPSYEEIAEAAYRRYLSRGGSDGRDFDDWIEAERELRSRT